MARSKVLPEKRKTKTSNLPALQTKTFAEITSAHGFGFYIQSSGWLARLVWFVLTLTSTVLAIFFTVRIGISFFKPPFYSTDISIVSPHAKYVSLPDIVVCDPSPWDFEKAATLNILVKQLSYIARLLYPQSPMNYSLFKDLDKEYKEI